MLTRTLALLWTSWNLNPVLGSRLDQGNFALSSGRWLHYQSASLYLGVQIVSAIFSGGGRGNTRDRPTYPPGGITIPIVHRLSYTSVFTYADFRCLSVPPCFHHILAQLQSFSNMLRLVQQIFSPLKHPMNILSRLPRVLGLVEGTMTWFFKFEVRKLTNFNSSYQQVTLFTSEGLRTR